MEYVNQYTDEVMTLPGDRGLTQAERDAGWIPAEDTIAAIEAREQAALEADVDHGNRELAAAAVRSGVPFDWPRTVVGRNPASGLSDFRSQAPLRHPSLAGHERWGLDPYQDGKSFDKLQQFAREALAKLEPVTPPPLRTLKELRAELAQAMARLPEHSLAHIVVTRRLEEMDKAPGGRLDDAVARAVVAGMLAWVLREVEARPKARPKAIGPVTSTR